MQVQLIAPSGASLDARSPQAGISWLIGQGVSVLNTECTERVHQRFSGSDAERVTELNSLSALPASTTVMAMRGGYGLHRLLGSIEWQAIHKAVKAGLQICGHSDFTAFHLGLLAKTGSISLAGPMLNYDFGRIDENQVVAPDPFMWTHFQRAVQKRSLSAQVNTSQQLSGLGSKTKNSTGMLWGGNLTVLTSLIGTPYFPAEQQYQNGILFLEDVNEHPYRIERMLMQLLDAGILAKQSAIVMGGFSAYRLYDNDRGYSLQVAFELIRSRLPGSIPMLTDLPFGHQPNKLTLPVGAIVEIEANDAGYSLQADW
ncbi:LD-carboxypeptidase [Polynucleobacter sp.]|uniref:LD-carboxypeptidase n=1 Tax=Polynucleobacter sp. TaxID=2029855 RepID=UPI002732FA5A|nr:LD-carboxypeptidase [Polynucleobacter sp.]MDP3122268.1 LD-carboxypeptidase [Polynucleobacter sp.]